MNRERDFDRVLEHWLLDGASEMPDRVFGTVLDRIERVPQRRIARLKLRFHDMTPMLKIAAAAALVLAIVVGGVSLFGRSDQGGVGGPAATPVVASQTPAPSPTPLPSIEGSWKACPTAAEILAAGGQPDEAQGNAGCTIIEFHGGVFTEFGASAEPGPPGTYVLRGDQIQIDRSNGEQFHYGWIVSGDTLTFRKPDLVTGVAPAPWLALPFQRDGA